MAEESPDLATAERPDDDREYELHRIEFHVCELCLTAAGGECHVPGCTFWMQDAPVGSVLAWLRTRWQWTRDSTPGATG